MAGELSGEVPPNTPITQLEKEFLSEKITIDGGTPTSKRVEGLWIELAGAVGIDLVGKTWRQARHEYYISLS